MPNTFAYFMVFAWPVIALIAFRRLPLAAGVAAAMVGGYLLLPVRGGIDLPLLPTFNKSFSISLAGLLLILVTPKPRGHRAVRPDLLPGWLPAAVWTRLCLAGIIGGAVMTVLFNAEPLVYPRTFIPGLSAYDAASDVLTQMTWLLPFLIARRVFASTEAQVHLLRILVVAAALYCFLALFELRMSPQLNVWIYGFFPHSFLQHVRGGGYRPLVFLDHGLSLSLFLVVAFLGTLASVGMLPDRQRAKVFAIAGFLFVVLVLSKSLGALFIALFIAPVLLLASPRGRLAFAAVITVAVLAFPVLRSTGAVPTGPILSVAQSIDPARAASFSTRLRNEDILLAKANQKPLFGWGAWGRSRVYDTQGNDISTTDGAWIIQFGVGGWVRYLSVFGLICLPVLLLWRRRDTLQPDEVTIALALMLTANLIDLLPNSSFTPITWMMAGALAGRLEWQRSESPEVAAASPGRKPVFSPGALADAKLSTDPAAARPRSPYTPVLRPAPGQASGKDYPAR